jgi:hypothetical protein
MMDKVRKPSNSEFQGCVGGLYCLHLHTQLPSKKQIASEAYSCLLLAENVDNVLLQTFVNVRP